ncbi:MAG: septum formation initiator family protein [Oscillospiraceae bacterium]|nr:septum formation initiator family protein [Oscillospiraceae bacterium]
MTYLQSLSDQTYVFLQAFGFGFLLGVFYDVFRTVRLAFSSGKRFIFVQDIIYVMVCAVASFLFFLVVNNGTVRGYAFLAELMGWLVYYFSLGVVAIRFSAMTVRFIRKLFFIVSRPFIFVYGIIVKIARKISLFLKKSSKKIAKKLKFLLKLYTVMVYNIRNILRKKANADGTEIMPESKKKSNKKKAGISFILTVAFLVMVCYFFVQFFSLRTEIREKQATIEALSLQYKQQTDENAELEDILKEKNIDKYVKNKARDEDLGYVFPNERVYYDPDAE